MERVTTGRDAAGFFLYLREDKMKKKIIVLFMATVLTTVLAAGCGSSKESEPAAENEAVESSETDENADVPEEDAAEEDEENYDTGDASLDDPLNGDEIGENELLVVSFGTSFNDSRRLTIGSIEKALADAFPDYSTRRAFTSQIIIDHVKERDGEVIDNVGEALDRAVNNGVKTLMVQPTHLMNGFEYEELSEELAGYADAFDKVIIGQPLLTSDEDFSTVANAIVAATKEYDDGKTAICFMGHGTEADSNAVYEKMQNVLSDMGEKNYFVGTVEASPSLDDVVNMVKAGDYERVVLEPLMVVAGDHANNDMAGDEPDSWKSVFEAEGYEVVPLLRGLGELEEIQNLYVKHVNSTLKEAGLEPASSENQEGGSDKVADASEMTEVEDVVDPGMVPVYADSLKDGVYDVAMRSSSSMFKADHAALSVKDGSMEAVLYMTSKSYLYMFAGTAEEAAEAPESEYIELIPEDEDMATFTLPLNALDEGESFAAFSKKKEKWYDRTLLFEAASLPDDAFAESRGTDAESLELKDGEYTVDVSLEGGSGKASVESPAKLTVKDGTYTALIVWSSSNYDYMIVNGEQYDPVNTEGNSAFEIPADKFDCMTKIQADTTAMSKPYLIDYTLYFDSSTIEKAE